MPRREPKKGREGTGRTSGEGGADGDARGSALGEWIKSIAIAAVIFVILRTFLLQTFVITSGSMEDTLLVGDFLLVNRAAIGGRIPFTDVNMPGYDEPERFDILVFDPPHEDELKLVKRMVGMPGDTLAMRSGVLFLNGDPVDEPYVRHEDRGDQYDPWMEWQRDYLVDSVDASTYRPTRDTWGPLVVPAEHYFMLGDNRDSSLDSRYWGLLEAWRLEGRAVLIYFSYDKEVLKPFPALTAMRPGRIGDIIR